MVAVRHADRERKLEYLEGIIEACWSHWYDMNSEEQIKNLICEAWFIVLRDGISPESMHQALSAIPEYRALQGK